MKRQRFASTFYYFVRAGNAVVPSASSDTVSAVSKPAPFFELELVNEPRISVGDTLKVRAFLTPAQHDIAGASLYLTFDDSSLTLIDANPAVTDTIPFRVDTTLAQISIVENKLHGAMKGKINFSLAEMSIPAGVEPVALGEIWFRTVKDRATTLTIDDEPLLNRRSAVVEAVTGEWILPFITLRPTQVAIRDFLVKGTVKLEGRSAPNLGLPVTFTFLDSAGRALESPLNDEDRLTAGIQQSLSATGSFAFAQIPAGKYRIFAKPRSYLAGQVRGDSVTVGDSLSTTITLRERKRIPQFCALAMRTMTTTSTSPTTASSCAISVLRHPTRLIGPELSLPTSTVTTLSIWLTSFSLPRILAMLVRVSARTCWRNRLNRQARYQS